MTHKDITIILPVYNEEANIPIIQNKIESVLKEMKVSFNILYVNDGSTDASNKIIVSLSKKNSNVFYITLSRNFGHQIALSAGLKYCKSRCAVIIDADLQDPPHLIKELYTEYNKGYDVVYAKRNKRKGETLFKKITAKLYYRLLRKLVKFDIPLDTADYRLLSDKVVNLLNQMPEKNKYIRGQIAWLGFKQSFVLYDRNSRIHGKSGYSFSKMLQLAINGIIGFSDKPLAYVTKFGFLISLFSFLTIIYAIVSHFILEVTITGWTSLIITVAFLGGIQLLSIGIIGEYISRINQNVTQRPTYVIKDSNIETKKSSK